MHDCESEAAAELVRAIMDLRAEITREGRAIFARWRRRIERQDFAVSALLLRRAGGAAGEDDLPYPTARTIPQIFHRLKVGDRVSVDDDKLRGTVVRQVPAGWVVRFDACRDKGFKLAPENGLNFPDVELGLSPLSDADLAALDFAVARADMVGPSFVEKAAHVAYAQEAIAARRRNWSTLALVARIETPRAVKNLPESSCRRRGGSRRA